MCARSLPQLAVVGSQDHSPLLVLGACLPRVAPNVLLNKRDVRVAASTCGAVWKDADHHCCDATTRSLRRWWPAWCARTRPLPSASNMSGSCLPCSNGPSRRNGMATAPRSFAPFAALTLFVPSAWPTAARWSFMHSSRLPRRRRVRTASTQSFSRSLWNRFVGGCALVTGWACSVLMRDDGPEAQLEDKHLERRALLAECCGALTPFVKVKRRRPTSRLYAGPQLTRANSMDPGGPGGMCT